MGVIEEAQKRVNEQTLDCLKDEARRFTIIQGRGQRVADHHTLFEKR